MIAEGILQAHPLGPDSFVRVDHRGAEGGGKADGLLQVGHADFGPHQRAMRAQAGGPHAVAVQDVLDLERVLVHRDRMEVARLAQQLPPVVDHRLDVLEAQLRRPLDARPRRICPRGG